jgi:phosphate starvation-inducible PhoH-like protein
MKATPQQQIYTKSIRSSKPFTVAIGPSGTGKTKIGVLCAVEALLNREYEKMVITRPAVTVDESHGFLPGDLKRKMDPYVIPIYDYLMVAKNSAIGGNITKRIEVVPLSHMRGRTFDRTIVLADESQNTSVSQMKMLVTRIGSNSKLIINGDIGQTDRKHGNNGLLDLVERLEMCEDQDMFDIISLSSDDIRRSKAVKFAVSLYEMNDGDKEGSMANCVQPNDVF